MLCSILLNVSFVYFIVVIIKGFHNDKGFTITHSSYNHGHVCIVSLGIKRVRILDLPVWSLFITKNMKCTLKLCYRITQGSHFLENPGMSGNSVLTGMSGNSCNQMPFAWLFIY